MINDDDESDEGGNSEAPSDDNTDNDELLSHLVDMDEPFHAEIDLDDYMISATHVKMKRNIQAEHLSKIWRIDMETASKTLDITSQNCDRKLATGLSRNYATNDKMLRYKRIKEFFFVDTVYATKKAGKSSRGNSCCQLFVTDKGFIYVVPMTKELDVLKAVKQFEKILALPML
jgi:hypothetical protein